MTDTGKHIKFTITPVVAAITPYSMSVISNDMYIMASGYVHDNKVSLAQHYLFSASIEVGLKAAILADDCTNNRKKEIKKINHNLERAYARFVSLYDEIYSQDELSTLNQINKFYQNKGLEYFTIDVMGSAIRGYKDMPDIQNIKSVAETTNKFLLSNKLFINAKTTEKPGGGFLNFV